MMRPLGSSFLIGLFALVTTAAHAEPVQVTLTDADGQPLEFAVISVPGEPGRPLEQAIMDQIDVEFRPHVLTVPVGSKVLFPNSDNIRHHVYSFSEAKTFETQLYANEARPTISFDTAGIVALGCNIHDQMRGYIYVSPHQQSNVTDATGRATVNLNGDTELLIWHPWLQQQKREQITVAVKDDQRELSLQVDVKAPEQSKEKPSRLQERFNRRTGND